MSFSYVSLNSYQSDSLDKIDKWDEKQCQPGGFSYTKRKIDNLYMDKSENID